MSRRSRRPLPLPGTKKYLVNNLTVDEARRMMIHEGEVTVAGAVQRLAGILMVAGLSARAIAVEDATALHLLLPTVAEYLALLAGIPLVAAVMREPLLAKEARKSVFSLAFFAAVWAVYVLGKPAGWQPAAFPAAALDSLHGAWVEVRSHGMHWPMALAAAGMIASLPLRVRQLREHGPPFVAVGIGCAMRLLLLLPAPVVVAWGRSQGIRVTWVVWAILLAAELAALWMHLDVQRRLRRHTAAGDGAGRGSAGTGAD